MTERTGYIDVREALRATFMNKKPQPRTEDLPGHAPKLPETLQELDEFDGERTFADEVDDYMLRVHGCTADEYAGRLPKTEEEGRFRERRGLPWVRDNGEKPLQFTPGTLKHDAEAEARIRVSVLMDRGVLRDTATKIARAETSRTIRSTDLMIHTRAWRNKKPSVSGYRHCMLSGHRGAGKTFAAAWSVGQITAVEAKAVNPDTARFISAADFADLTYDRMSEEKRRKFEGLLEFSLLAIDDMGVEAMNDRVESKWYQLINGRHESPMLRTMYTTQLDEENFRKRYSDAICDRIFSSGSAKHVRGESQR